MRRNLSETLAIWLGSRSEWCIGQIRIARAAQGFDLCHRDDSNRDDLKVFSSPFDARFLAQWDDADAYRPLKTAPNLRHGWRLILPDIDELRHAIDYFYPAMLGLLRDWDRSALKPVPLRETLSRQSGMYVMARKISDAQAQDTIAACCNSQSRCLKIILWRISAETLITALPEAKFIPPEAASASGRENFPMLCDEACNLLVSESRAAVKRAAQSDSPSRSQPK